jgi:hypothetical protein
MSTRLTKFSSSFIEFYVQGYIHSKGFLFTSPPCITQFDQGIRTRDCSLSDLFANLLLKGTDA